MAKKTAKQIKITLRKSVIKAKPKQRRTVTALGLRKIDSSVIQTATAPVLGMVAAVSHLVEVEDLG